MSRVPLLITTAEGRAVLHVVAEHVHVCLCAVTEHSRTWSPDRWHHHHHNCHYHHHVILNSAEQLMMAGKIISCRISSLDSRSFYRRTHSHQLCSALHIHTGSCPGGPLLMISCETRVPLYFNAFLSSCLMSAQHALVSAHTYSTLRMYSVQFCTYRHQCVHYMRECIKSMSSLLWWVCMRGHVQIRCGNRRAEGICALQLSIWWWFWTGRGEF